MGNQNVLLLRCGTLSKARRQDNSLQLSTKRLTMPGNKNNSCDFYQTKNSNRACQCTLLQKNCYHRLAGTWVLFLLPNRSIFFQKKSPIKDRPISSPEPPGGVVRGKFSGGGSNKRGIKERSLWNFNHSGRTKYYLLSFVVGFVQGYWVQLSKFRIKKSALPDNYCQKRKYSNMKWQVLSWHRLFNLLFSFSLLSNNFHSSQQRNTSEAISF